MIEFEIALDSRSRKDNNINAFRTRLIQMLQHLKCGLHLVAGCPPGPKMHLIYSKSQLLQSHPSSDEQLLASWMFTNLLKRIFRGMRKKLRYFLKRTSNPKIATFWLFTPQTVSMMKDIIYIFCIVAYICSSRIHNVQKLMGVLAMHKLAGDLSK